MNSSKPVCERGGMPSKKEALLEAAKELFGELGYAETTFKKISDKAGVALGLLTHHYGNKEKLFLASGLDVLENFHSFLENAVKDSPDGYTAVMRFCRAYLDFSLDKNSNWLVLVRCSPYSDMKTGADRDLMDARFANILEMLAELLETGMNDGSIAPMNSNALAQVIVSLMVGANRTMLLTPYAPANLYDDVLNFVSRALKSCRGAAE